MNVRSIERKIIKLVKKIDKIQKEIRLETDDLEIEFLNVEIVYFFLHAFFLTILPSNKFNL